MTKDPDAMNDVILTCSDHLQDIGEVVAVAPSLAFAFGAINGAVVAHNTIRGKDGSLFYLIENVPDAPAVGKFARIRLTLGG